MHIILEEIIPYSFTQCQILDPVTNFGRATPVECFVKEKIWQPNCLCWFSVSYLHACLVDWLIDWFLDFSFLFCRNWSTGWHIYDIPASSDDGGKPDLSCVKGKNSWLTNKLRTLENRFVVRCSLLVFFFVAVFLFKLRKDNNVADERTERKSTPNIQMLSILKEVHNWTQIRFSSDLGVRNTTT